MLFLTEADYASRIKASALAILTEGDATILAAAESSAESQIRSRLAVRYDVDGIFNKTGTDRNSEIIMTMIDLTLYHLTTRITPGQIPETRKDRYADALEWLNKVARGDYATDLPLEGDADEDGVDDKNVIQWGGMAPRDPYY